MEEQTKKDQSKSLEEEKILTYLQSLKEHMCSSKNIKDEQKRGKLLSSMEEAKMHLLSKLAKIQEEKSLETKFLNLSKDESNEDNNDNEVQKRSLIRPPTKLIEERKIKRDEKSKHEIVLIL